MSNQPNVFSVVAGAPFFPSFVSALKQGRIIKDFSIENPLALSQIKIYTPTKRAARALEEAIIASSDGAASFLPDIRPLGEMNWDNFFSFFSLENDLPMCMIWHPIYDDDDDDDCGIDSNKKC